MWKIKKKRLWPKRKSTLPVAKINQVKKLVSSPNELKSSLLQEYNERLRRREVRPGIKDQKKMDFELMKLKAIKTK